MNLLKSKKNKMPSKGEKPKYVQGEKVLCYHGPLLYEAKCIDVDSSNDEAKYYVHYQGWNKTWDEWITDDRMIKFNDVGLKKQKELQDDYKESRKKKQGKKGHAGDKRRNKQDKTKKLGSVSDASNRSIPEGSEDGHESKVAGDDETKTDAGTSVISEETSTIDDLTPLSKPNKYKRKTDTARKRKLSTEVSEDGVFGGAGSEKLEVEDDSKSVTTTSIAAKDDIGKLEEVSSGPTVGKQDIVTPANPQKSTLNTRLRKHVLLPLDENIVDLESYSAGINADVLKVAMSEKLRFWLTDDWDLITRQSRLTNLPARITVNEVLGRYRNYIDAEQNINNNGSPTPSNSISPTKMREMKLELIDGIKKYFNMALGSMLLYKFERLQYMDLLDRYSSQKSELSGLYGPIHILRLLINIQKLIMYTKTDKVSIQCLGDLLQHFVDFLDSHCDEFFKLEDYITATADYTRRAMC